MGFYSTHNCVWYKFFIVRAVSSKSAPICQYRIKLITLEGAKEIVCGMTKSVCDISLQLEDVLTLCGGVGRYLEMAIIQMSKLGAFRQNGSITKKFRADSYNYLL